MGQRFSPDFSWVSGFHRYPLCRAPLADGDNLVALFSKDAAPHASSLRELQFRRDDDFLGYGFLHERKSRRRTHAFRIWMNGLEWNLESKRDDFWDVGRRGLLLQRLPVA